MLWWGEARVVGVGGGWIKMAATSQQKRGDRRTPALKAEKTSEILATPSVSWADQLSAAFCPSTRSFPERTWELY